ncbi:MAG: U32 family peptidase [Spirochaetes bacterium]|jgi:collagenase-like PrtC family protease|nr:U32 family peptidase [Spirochaetota bacterium]
MNLIVPCNWDNTLIEKLKDTDVRTFYAKADADHIGGGRNSHLLPKVTQDEIVAFIRKAQGAGIEFNYLLNSACLGGNTANKEWQQKLLETLDLVAATGTKRVTIASPYLIKVMKKRHPHIKITVSSFARIHTLQKAQFYESMGVDEITLDFNANRDFHTLELLKSKLSCNLVLMTNLFCLYQCPYALEHCVRNSHASQEAEDPIEGDNYCCYSCTSTFIDNPTEIIRSPWIRPEDLQVYEEIGIDTFKLVERIFPTHLILKITRAYLSRKYEENLMDLMSFKLGLLYEIQAKFKGSINTAPLLENLQTLQPYIKNQKLNGFIDFFKNHRCSTMDCSDCGYCEHIAKEVLLFPDEKKLKHASHVFKQAIRRLTFQ